MAKLRRVLGLRRSFVLLGLGLLALGACGIDKPAGAGTGGMTAAGTGGANTQGTGGTSDLGGAPGTGGVSPANGGAGGAAITGSGGATAGGGGGTVSLPTGLQYNGTISFFRVVL